MVLSRSGGSAEKPLEQLSDEEFWDRARELASTAPVAVHPEEYLECELRHGRCFVPLTALYQVVPPPYRLALLPATPRWMLGLIAWRGEAVAVVDLDVYLFGPDEAALANAHPYFAEPGEGTLLVADLAGLPVGLFVPAIGSIIAIESTQITSAATSPVPGSSPLAEMLNGVYAGSFVLDVPALLAGIVQQIEMAATHG